MWVYAAVIVGSIVVAFLIASVIKVPSSAGKVDYRRKPEAKVGTAPKDDEELKEVVFEEIGEVVKSKYQREEIAKVVSNVFDRELEARIKEHTEGLRSQYAKELDERAKNEEIALKRYKKVLVEKKSTEAVIRSIAEGLVVVDAEGKVIMINPAAERLLDTSKKEKIGQSLTDNIKDEQLISLAKSSSGEGNREIELNSSQDETRRILRSSTAVIENENGETVGMVSVLSDITKQKELDELKAKFVASVSHELRTPLIAIDKSVSLLLTKSAGPTNETQKQFLTIASRNLKRLSSLINDILDMSKLEAGYLSLDCKPSSIKEVIDDASQSLQSWADAKSIAIVTNIQENIPNAEIDSNRIIQVFNNLVGNAIKFTPQKGTITIDAVKDEDKVKISVSDTGIGVSKDELAHIFDKFYQGEGRTSTDISGTGLGLSIVREIIELHDGQVWAESNEGEGMKFTFTVPLSA